MSEDTTLELHVGYPSPEEFENELGDLVTAKVASRIAAGDATLWGPAAEEEAAKRLGWVHAPERSVPLVEEIIGLREELRAEGIDRITLAGMGGSSLAPEVIAATYGVELEVLDTTDSGQVAEAIGTDLSRTLLVVSSKSGGTVETDSHRRAFSAAFEAIGVDPASRIVVVTDPGSPLHRLAEESGYRRVFLADDTVGGRFSALTAFGLVPAGLAGADIGALLQEAQEVLPVLTADAPENPALRLGAFLGAAHARDSEKLVIADHGSGLPGFGAWMEQLVAESTGKDGRGLLPVVVESPDAPGFADARADAILLFLGSSRPDIAPASGLAAAVSGRLGESFLLWEYAIAVAGYSIGINPFDQPDVEAAKVAARSLLSGEAPASGEPAFTDGAVDVYALALDLGHARTLHEAIDALLHAAPEYGYLAIQAYLDRFADAAAEELRPAAARRSGLQTSFGWGPRFLHSTGQYHKGGHQNGVFLQITAANRADLVIPDQPFSFGVLQLAQAQGDAQVLAERGRPVLRFHLHDRAEGLRQIAAALGGR
ncbi:glucose-6-phosphate isomerase [Sediminivirga luteola]|uniref:glucose-6-phosphate isomerase n=2 Tax=Sediminivirga luteola TaxID=1774748 RepID=UPI001F2B94DB|nr:glucose-6-phosphate isomerase [Sediminivirga luteola]